MEYLYWDLGLCTTSVSVEVEISGVEAFVRLMDAANFQDYLDDGDCIYYGGVWQESPVGLDIPYDDHWYLVIDGHEGRIKVHQVITHDN